MKMKSRTQTKKVWQVQDYRIDIEICKKNKVRRRERNSMICIQQ